MSFGACDIGKRRRNCGQRSGAKARLPSSSRNQAIRRSCRGDTSGEMSRKERLLFTSSTGHCRGLVRKAPCTKALQLFAERWPWLDKDNWFNLPRQSIRSSRQDRRGSSESSATTGRARRNEDRRPARTSAAGPGLLSCVPPIRQDWSDDTRDRHASAQTRCRRSSRLC